MKQGNLIHLLKTQKDNVFKSTFYVQLQQSLDVWCIWVVLHGFSGQLRFGSLLTNDIRNHRKRLRSHLFPRRLEEENQVGFLIYHHHIFFSPNSAALSSSQGPSFEQSVSGCCKKKFVLTNLVWNSERQIYCKK